MHQTFACNISMYLRRTAFLIYDHLNVTYVVINCGIHGHHAPINPFHE